MTLENDLKVNEASATSLQNRYVYKVGSMLIERNPPRYLSVGPGGLYVENWFQLNRRNDTLNTSVLDKGKTSVRNPYRNLWEQKGVQWPSQKQLSTSASASSCSQSSLSFSMDEPQSLLSDEYVLALGIKESLKNVKANPSELDQEIAINRSHAIVNNV